MDKLNTVQFYLNIFFFCHLIIILSDNYSEAYNHSVDHHREDYGEHFGSISVESTS